MTPAAHRLATISREMDLLIADVVAAGVVGMLEARRSEEQPPLAVIGNLLVEALELLARTVDRIEAS